MTTGRDYPGPILVRLSVMMDELMRIAEQIEAHERAREFAARRRVRAEDVPRAENVVPFRRPTSSQKGLV